MVLPLIVVFRLAHAGYTAHRLWLNPGCIEHNLDPHPQHDKLALA